MESGRSFLLGALSVFVWTVLFAALYVLVAFLYGLLCSLPVIGRIFTFIAYSVAVKDWVIPLRDVILSFIAARISTPVIHRLMHDRTEHAVNVTKVTCFSIQAIFWIGAMIIAGDFAFNSIAQCIALLIGIGIGLRVAEFTPDSSKMVHVFPTIPTRPSETPPASVEVSMDRHRVKSPSEIFEELESRKDDHREVPMEKPREQVISDFLDDLERSKAEVRELQRKNANRR